MNAQAGIKQVHMATDHGAGLQAKMEECMKEREALQVSQAREQERINELNLIISSCEAGLKPFRDIDTEFDVRQPHPSVVDEPDYPRG